MPESVPSMRYSSVCNIVSMKYMGHCLLIESTDYDVLFTYVI